MSSPVSSTDRSASSTVSSTVSSPGRGASSTYPPAGTDRSALDTSGDSTIPMSRLVGIEMRKMTDTRAGFWLLVTIAILTAAVLALFFFATDDADRTFVNFMGVTGTPQGFLLPVLGVLLITSEWGQRTALTTFTLVPHRGRVLAAKALAAVLFGLAAILVAMALAAVATLVGGGDDAWANIGLDDVGKYALLQVSGILQGLAFGMLLLNSASAIVLFFVLPIGFSIITSLVDTFRDIQPWVDLGTSQSPLFDASHLSGEQWAQLAVSSAIWILLPFVLGWIRVTRAEVK